MRIIVINQSYSDMIQRLVCQLVYNSTEILTAVTEQEFTCSVTPVISARAHKPPLPCIGRRGAVGTERETEVDKFPVCLNADTVGQPRDDILRINRILHREILTVDRAQHSDLVAAARRQGLIGFVIGRLVGIHIRADKGDVQRLILPCRHGHGHIGGVAEYHGRPRRDRNLTVRNFDGGAVHLGGDERRIFRVRNQRIERHIHVVTRGDRLTAVVALTVLVRIRVDTEIFALDAVPCLIGPVAVNSALDTRVEAGADADRGRSAERRQIVFKGVEQYVIEVDIVVPVRIDHADIQEFSV